MGAQVLCGSSWVKLGHVLALLYGAMWCLLLPFFTGCPARLGLPCQAVLPACFHFIFDFFDHPFHFLFELLVDILFHFLPGVFVLLCIAQIAVGQGCLVIGARSPCTCLVIFVSLSPVALG